MAEPMEVRLLLPQVWESIMKQTLHTSQNDSPYRLEVCLRYLIRSQYEERGTVVSVRMEAPTVGSTMKQPLTLFRGSGVSLPDS